MIKLFNKLVDSYNEKAKAKFVQMKENTQETPDRDVFEMATNKVIGDLFLKVFAISLCVFVIGAVIGVYIGVVQNITVGYTILVCAFCAYVFAIFIPIPVRKLVKKLNPY